MAQSILTGQSRHMALELLQHFSQLSHTRGEQTLGVVINTSERAANESTLTGSDSNQPAKPDEPVEPA